jgi:hypothetical protein
VYLVSDTFPDNFAEGLTVVLEDQIDGNRPEDVLIPFIKITVDSLQYVSRLFNFFPGGGDIFDRSAREELELEYVRDPACRAVDRSTVRVQHRYQGYLYGRFVIMANMLSLLWALGYLFYCLNRHP